MVMVSEHPGTTVEQQLAALDLFAGADRELLATVAERSVEIEVPKGRELTTAGTEAREFVVILDGYAAVSIAGVPISYLGAGSCFGEMSLIDGRPRTADVVALSPMRLIVISREDFLHLIERSPAFCGRLLTVVVGRLRLANAQLAERAEVGSGPPSPETASARSVNAARSGARRDRVRTRGGGRNGIDDDDEAMRWLARTLAWDRTARPSSGAEARGRPRGRRTSPGGREPRSCRRDAAARPSPSGCGSRSGRRSVHRGSGCPGATTGSREGREPIDDRLRRAWWLRPPGTGTRDGAARPVVRATADRYRDRRGWGRTPGGHGGWRQT